MSDTMKSWDLFEGFPRYQRAVARTMKMQGERDAVIEGAFGLAGEAGEVVDRIKKYLYQGHTENIKADLVEELGDVLWYLTDLCTLFDIELSQVAGFNVAKLLDRYPAGFDEAASRARVEETSPAEHAKNMRLRQWERRQGRVDLREDGGLIGGVRFYDNGSRQSLEDEHNIEYGTDTL